MRGITGEGERGNECVVGMVKNKAMRNERQCSEGQSLLDTHHCQGDGPAAAELVEALLHAK